MSVVSNVRTVSKWQVPAVNVDYNIISYHDKHVLKLQPVADWSAVSDLRKSFYLLVLGHSLIGQNGH